MMLRQKVIRGINIDFTSKWSLKLLIKAIRCLIKVDNLEPNSLEWWVTNPCFLNHVYVEVIEISMHVTIVVCSSMLFNIELYFICMTCCLLTWMSFDPFSKVYHSLPRSPKHLHAPLDYWAWTWTNLLEIAIFHFICKCHLMHFIWTCNES